MASELEITKNDFISDSYNYSRKSKIALEDSQFLIFAEFLDETDIISTPVLSRIVDKFKNANCSILGYCLNSFQSAEKKSESTEDGLEENDDSESLLQPTNSEFKWEYCLFNGFFSGNPQLTKTNKTDISKSLKEVVRFIEKTFSNSLIDDVCEARNLQEQLISKKNQNALDRIDIFIVTDSIIDQEELETSVFIKSVDLTCRIYYWDIKKWNDLKRNKSKRLPINIDFKENDYRLYNVDFIEKVVNNKLSYFLSIFPGNLISDIYDYNKTRVLENNVRVFLSANRTANKAIRETLKQQEERSKFFCYNNGISATAESVIIEGGKIVKINDFQIVNGGQTAASIHYAHKKDKSSLDGVFVAVKITALKKDDDYSKTVTKISLAANTQTAISSSDFYANNSYLIEIERFSTKNPVQNKSEKNIYYFFERMKGQYNVTMSGIGNKRLQQIWEQSHPKIFMFNKIDIARWSNIMNELPYIAATGAEKQFIDFMENKNFEKKEISLGRYKSLVGLGLLFARIYRLCGKANGKVYPSLTIDPNTNTHVPVAMSTAIYTMSYLHMITDGCIDYWSIYDYQYGICDSLINKERKDSKIDLILVNTIKLCWQQISSFGGAAAQESSKKKECWDYVKSNVKLSAKDKENLRSYQISLAERDKRDSIVVQDEDFSYFDSLNILLKNNATVLQLLGRVAEGQSDYFKQRITINNQLKKIKSKNQILTKKKVEEIFVFYNELKAEGFLFEEIIENNGIEIYIPFDQIFIQIFKARDEFLRKLEEYTLSNELEFEKNEKQYFEIKEIIEKYYREYGLSIDDFSKLHKVMCNSEYLI
jgi:hypothetical protein